MKNKIVVALKGIIVHNQHALIIQRSQDDEVGANTWEFVGGKLDFGENLEDGLKREIFEEVGLDVIVDKLIYATTFNTDEHRQVVILTYLCKSDSDLVTLSNEHKDYLWATTEDMQNLLSKPILDDMTKNNVWDITSTAKREATS